MIGHLQQLSRQSQLIAAAFRNPHSLTAVQQASLAAAAASSHPHLAPASSRVWQCSTPLAASGSYRRSSSDAGPKSSSSSAGTGSTHNSDAGGIEGVAHKLHVPPAFAAGAAAAGGAAGAAAKSVAKQASRLVKLVQSTSLSEATWLQISSTWQSHSASITALTAAAATAGLYHLVAAAVGHVVDVSDPAAHWSCLAASAAGVTAAGLQLRSAFTVDPERVYRITMRKLNRHAGLQEVMGSPLAGSDVRLELVTQGSLFVQETLLPKRRAPRIHLMFQLTGPTKTGVVSVVAKKAFGSKYAFRSLMVELPDRPLTQQAGAAAASAAMQQVAAAAAAATGSPKQQPQPSSQQAPSSSNAGSSESSSSSSSTSASAAASGKPAASADPARIYIIGGPPGSSSSSTRHLSPTALLEDLKDPLLYSLKHNLVVYEAEDEAEGQLAWSKPAADADQATWWDESKAAAAALACRAYAAGCSAAAATATTLSTAVAQLRSQAHRTGASAATPSSNNSSSSTDSTVGDAAGSPQSGTAPPVSGAPNATSTASSSGASSSTEVQRDAAATAGKASSAAGQ